MRLFLLICSIFILHFFHSVTVIHAQDSTDNAQSSNHLGITANLNLYSYREDLLVPLSFDGPGFSIGSKYVHWGEGTFWQASLRFGVGILNNSYSHDAYSLNIEIHGAWMKRLKSFPGKGEFWLGVDMPLQMNNLYLESWDESHLYWMTVYSIGPTLGCNKNISSTDKLFIRLNFPVLSLISRPEEYRNTTQEALTKVGFHFTEPNKSLQLESFGSYFSVCLRVNLITNNNVSGWNFGFEFQYSHFKDPKPFSKMYTSLSAVYLWSI